MLTGKVNAIIDCRDEIDDIVVRKLAAIKRILDIDCEIAKENVSVVNEICWKKRTLIEKPALMYF